MLLILLEALGAGCILVLIVWWTMFSGRERGELRQDEPVDDASRAQVAPAADPPPPVQAPPVDPKG